MESYDDDALDAFRAPRTADGSRAVRRTDSNVDVHARGFDALLKDLSAPGAPDAVDVGIRHHVERVIVDAIATTIATTIARSESGVRVDVIELGAPSPRRRLV